MTAITTPRNTPWRDCILTPLPVAEGESIPEGAIVCVNSDGYAVNGKADATLKYAGCADSSVDNIEGQDGDLLINVRAHKTFRWDQDGSIKQASLLGHAYILDNQTLTATDGSDAKATLAVAAKYARAGTIVMIDADGVWIY